VKARARVQISNMSFARTGTHGDGYGERENRGTQVERQATESSESPCTRANMSFARADAHDDGYGERANRSRQIDRQAVEGREGPCARANMRFTLRDEALRSLLNYE